MYKFSGVLANIYLSYIHRIPFAFHLNQPAACILDSLPVVSEL